MGLKRQFEHLSEKTTPLEEKQWVRRVREDGDRSAFEKIFRTYYNRLHSFAYTYVKNREQAEDIIQDIFFKIWLNKEDWDPPGKVKHYLFNAVRNEALNLIRHDKIRSDSEATVIDLYKELQKRNCKEELQSKELRTAIQTEIDKLPDRCREIYLLNRRNGLTYAEIADYLEISINTVGTQMGRALKVLRENLTDYLSIIIVLFLTKLFF